jgi:hypothetical protein
MKESTLIQSVLGFDFNVEIKDQNGDVLKTGCRSCVTPVRKARIKSKILDPNFFTHYNEALIAKIRDMRNNNY